MSQAWTDDVFAADHAGTTDLQNMENNFAALKSMFSGASAPSNAVAGMPWFHTTNKLLKLRNNANDAWLGVMYGAATLKIWAYVAAAPDGWALDLTLSDKVLAIKGGSDAYNVAGGSTAGTWSISSIAVNNESSHTHAGPSHNHTATKTMGYGAPGSYPDTYIDVVTDVSISNGGTANTGAGSTHAHGLSVGNTWRPAAAVGVIMYPNV